MTLQCHRILVIKSSPKRPQPSNKDIVIINTAQMLRAAYTTHSGMSSSQKFCCCRIDFLQYLVLIFSIPRDISFLLFFHCKFLSNICPTFLYFWQHNNSKRKSHYLYSDSHLYNSPSINVPSSFLSQAVRNA